MCRDRTARRSQSEPLASNVDGEFACDTVLLDREANSARRRRRLPKPTDQPEVEPTGIDPLRQMTDEQARLSRRPAVLHPDPDREE